MSITKEELEACSLPFYVEDPCGRGAEIGGYRGEDNSYLVTTPDNSKWVSEASLMEQYSLLKPKLQPSVVSPLRLSQPSLRCTKCGTERTSTPVRTAGTRCGEMISDGSGRMVMQCSGVLTRTSASAPCPDIALTDGVPALIAPTPSATHTPTFDTDKAFLEWWSSVDNPWRYSGTEKRKDACFFVWQAAVKAVDKHVADRTEVLLNLIAEMQTYKYKEDKDE